MSTKRGLFDSILIYLSILLSGTDIWSFTIGDSNVRIIQFFYLLVLIYFLLSYGIKILIDRKIIVFLICMIISTIFAIDKIQSLKYLAFGLYNIFIIVPIFYLYLKNHSKEILLKICSFVIYTIFILVCIQMFFEMILKIQIPFFTSQHYEIFIRPSLWFYEPSYLATFVSFFLALFSYLAISLKKNRYYIELVLACLIILTTTSTTGFLAIFLSVTLAFIIRLFKTHNFGKNITDSCIFITLGIISILLFKLLLPNVFESFFMRIFDQGIEKASGERVHDYHYAIEIFQNYPIFGCGLDCYGVYLNDKALVPTNLTLELLSTMGIVGTIAFYAIPLGLIYQNYKLKHLKNNDLGYQSSSILFALLILILVLQANQNFMRLYLWIFISISCSCVLNFKNEIKKNNIYDKYKYFAIM